MKPSPKDKKYSILITGQELVELKRFTGDMAEAFGLDRKIGKYQGKQTISFYRWDLDCLEDVLAMTVENTRKYPDKSSPSYEAIMSLSDRIKRLRNQAYEELPYKTE